MKNLFLRGLAFTFFAMATTALPVKAGEYKAPTGNIRPVTVDDFMPHQNKAKEFNETWSYQFFFDNGTRAFVNISTLYIPASGKKIGCDMSFWNFKQKSYTVGRQYPPERLKADKATSTIDIKGEYKMEGKPGKGHHLLFTANKGGKFFLDVSFESAETGKVPGNGVWNIDGEQFAQYIHIPYGRVSGRIAYENDTIAVKGYAYMDQTWQTTQATEIASRSINFSSKTRQPQFAGRLSITHEGSYIGYALYNDGNGIKMATPKQIQDGDAPYDGKLFPKKTIDIQWNEDLPHLKFAVNKTLQKASLLDKVDGWLAKKAFKIAAGGEVLFYRGQSDGSLGNKMDWTITGVKD